MRRRLTLALVCLAASCSRAGDREPAAAAQLTAAQARAYQSICATCHARPDTGAPLVGDEAAWRGRRALGADLLLAHAVNGYRGMPPLGSCGACSEADLRALVVYVSGGAAEVQR
jgi:cytochrome c5